MFIQKIRLDNFRVYKGENILEFSPNADKNVSIISGNNGFGKTSLLTSLVWCLYGKLMVDVDERYRKEIYQSGGYKKYCQKLMNQVAIEENKQLLEELQLNMTDGDEKKKTDKKTENLLSFSVSIKFSNVFIPVIACKSLEVIRSYCIANDTESLSILIDGQINELTKQVGSEIFINDFILRKEIAKFFFFDAEKIVELAEITSTEDKRSLGRAYSEVLGIKKYIDLKDDLDNLRTRLRKKNLAKGDHEKLEKLTKQFADNEKDLEYNRTVLHERQEELTLKKQASDRLQEQLIRQGSSLTLQELKDFKLLKANLQEQLNNLKSKMQEMVELAPLAIASSKVSAIKEQLTLEQDQKDLQFHEALLKRKAKTLKAAITRSGKFSDKEIKNELNEIIDTHLVPSGEEMVEPLLDYSAEQENKFNAVYDHLQYSFSKTFKAIVADLRMQQTSLNTVNRKLADAESKENDPVIKKIRVSKTTLEDEIDTIEKRCIDYKSEILALEKSQKNLALQISELRKIIDVEKIDEAKDEVAKRLIGELETFIYKLKIRKKESLEQKILKELQVLMHKHHFVFDVRVIIDGELVDIELFDDQMRPIDKKVLSKGEQQLYATALLKALVEESHIRFPVFIDSPLQKFDKIHAQRIIKDFYPNVSEQVILFPLLEKELNETEYVLLSPKVAECFLIDHYAAYQSTFRKIDTAQLFSVSQNVPADV